MSALEIYGVRHLDESRWHREGSISRFISPEEAMSLERIDVDALSYCRLRTDPLAFMEMAEDRGQDHKNASVLKNLSRRSGLPALLFCTPKHGREIRSTSDFGIWTV